MFLNHRDDGVGEGNELIGKILASQVNLGFIELPCELALCRKLQQAGNEGMGNFEKRGSFLQQQQNMPPPR